LKSRNPCIEISAFFCILARVIEHQMKEKLKTLLVRIGKISWLKNKYFWAMFIFLLWILFLDENNLTAHHRNKLRLKALKEQRLFYREKIETDKSKLEELRSGSKNLEKYAREQFNMTKPGEDLFVVVEK
jgi:cell division protein DivIC